MTKQIPEHGFAGDPEHAQCQAINDALLGVRALMVAEAGASETAATNTPVTLDGWSASGTARGVTVDAANNRFVTAEAGVYWVTAQFGFDGTASTLYNFHFYVGGVKVDGGTARQIGTATGTGAVALAHFVEVAAGVAIEIKVLASAATRPMTLQDGTFMIYQVA
jgi:hypothetical protein